eukprot:gb/GFBE01068298.1/.p1 GENE.gb/GFBE01068298.1/~~gb/GFBE01068298.1/.p1  ORF type:complete len:296 (+),score=49.54 gb/GFBE01068298.1/:1-888(+)
MRAGDGSPEFSEAQRESLKQRLLLGIGRDVARPGPESDNAGLLRANDYLVHHRLASSSAAPSLESGNYGATPVAEEVAATVEASPAVFASKLLDPPEVFSPVFTLACLMLFLSPIWQVVYLAGDRDVQFWIGSWFGHVTALLPAVFIVGFLVHVRLGRPHYAVVLACFLVPSLTLFALGRGLAQHGAEMAAMLRGDAGSCGAVGLQDAWNAARDLQQRCTGEASVDRGVQWCSQYEVEREQHSNDWDYFRATEESHGCAGWCDSGEALWTLDDSLRKDTCSLAVSQVFSRKVVSL